MEVDVQVQPAPEALDHRERARPAVRDSPPAGAPVVELEQRPREDPENRPERTLRNLSELERVAEQDDLASGRTHRERGSPFGGPRSAFFGS
ncbi:MAG: hypothetical protein AUH81_07170 [Candidatus Rokubacteria bacterium 13_1_40CM_4_69_5]|nr:MAG: hypothetical protein AUH81_07170 [Candidatus Rokubacteria bacterium 13_1_40CM_4_69_5]